MRVAVAFLAVGIGCSVAGCGGGGGSGGGGITSYTIGGIVAGLASGTQVTLENNGTDSLTVTANGSFSFATPLVSGASYSIRVQSHSLGQACSVNSGAGTVLAANVASVTVTCMPGSESILYSFGPSSGTDGQGPIAALTMDSAGNLYGTAGSGGANGTGAVFKVTLSGTETFLYSFGPTSGTDAQDPSEGGLIMDSAGNFYGTTYYGGTNGTGAVFKITRLGAESVLYSFGPSTGIDGRYPIAGLIMDSAGNFYGTTTYGGTNDTGTVFKITASGTESVLYSFGPSTGIDGQTPTAGLIMDSAGNLYGTTRYGGANGNGTLGSGTGTVFKITPAGTESILYSFGPGSGTDGQEPLAGLIVDSAGNLYGTTSSGGANKFTGTVFKID
jgi:uncharacterized repeat protein (TIGR03803 family)